MDDKTAKQKLQAQTEMDDTSIIYDELPEFQHPSVADLTNLGVQLICAPHFAEHTHEEIVQIAMSLWERSANILAAKNTDNVVTQSQIADHRINDLLARLYKYPDDRPYTKLEAAKQLYRQTRTDKEKLKRLKELVERITVSDPDRPSFSRIFNNSIRRNNGINADLFSILARLRERQKVVEKQQRINKLNQNREIKKELEMSIPQPPESDD